MRLFLGAVLAIAELPSQCAGWSQTPYDPAHPTRRTIAWPC
jgi:hypothetical protein